MSGTVDGTACTFVRGTPDPKRVRVQSWQLPGRDGYGSMRLGSGNSKFEYELVQFAASEAAAETWFLAIESSVGFYVTILDDHGQTYTSALIESADRVGKQPTKTPDGVRGQMLIRGILDP